MYAIRSYYGRAGSYTIPDTVTSIGDDAFSGCTSLTAIDVDPVNPSYSSLDGVLFNKAHTTLVAFPGGRAGSYTIPDSVTSIGRITSYNVCYTKLLRTAAMCAYKRTFRGCFCMFPAFRS